MVSPTGPPDHGRRALVRRGAPVRCGGAFSGTRTERQWLTGAEFSRQTYPKQLEEENQRLKKVVADPSVDNEMLQDVLRRKNESCPEG